MSENNWETVPLWSVARERRVTVNPSELGDRVVHYSIPAVDATGTGQVEETDSIKSVKLRLLGSEVLVSKLNPRKSRVVIVPDSALPIVSSTEFVGLLPEDPLEPRFLAYFLQSETTRQVLDSQVQSVTRSHQRVAPEDVTHLPLKMPPRQEQRRIADFLDAETSRIDQLVQFRRKQESTLEERYFTAISELTTPGISTADKRRLSWPWLPEGLATMRLGYAARVQSGITVHEARAKDSSDAIYPYLRVANVQGERVDLTEIKEITIPRHMAMRSMLRPGDVVMTEANGNPDNLGRGAVWGGEVANMVHQNHVFAIRVDRNTLIPEYLSALLATSHGRRYFRFTSTQVGIATTSSSKVLDFPVPVRTTSQQAEIVREYEALRLNSSRARSALARQLGLLTERRQALITAAVTGQFDVSTASGRNVSEGVSV
ncbi:restriction endonuclease subunit S [Streptomyces edwardsiae]|uniref:Restriction endonuclease subunit S n=1 Tax=Streptomyces edwardsiae TaxID=3075527 RepID=A0ABU2Q134_9ACTN|nr:restriction endonuclease subunit S [Streptomyces sp. DSM 41636]MDT0397220.1 restriction endonuclease subunit S [Streptomyces sp. DSM 41636]